MRVLSLYEECDEILIDGFMDNAFSVKMVLEIKTLNLQAVDAVELLLATTHDEGRAKA